MVDAELLLAPAVKSLTEINIKPITSRLYCGLEDHHFVACVFFNPFLKSDYCDMIDRGHPETIIKGMIRVVGLHNLPK